MKIYAGPCVIESKDHALFMAKEISSVVSEYDFDYVFKASFEKANRTSANSFVGHGLEYGIDVFKTIKEEVGCGVITDVHEPWQVEHLDVVDYLQIPAFLCRQTSLIEACAKSGKVTNVKKGQFLSPHETKNIVDKFNHFGGKEINLVERGTSFGYNNLVVDFTGLPVMRQYAPVVFDATHSVQKPGASGTGSSGAPEMIPYLIKAAVAVGVDGVFMEVHDNPKEALSDGANSLELDDLRSVLDVIKKYE
jgi:2-dehydro-3-deoxyphosphooctonate aldolase (KDO 8-P synthase)